MDGALDVAADRQFLCADLALYLCPSGDHDGRGAYLSLDVTKNSQGPMADNLADDRKARTNRGGRFRLRRITITRQPADFLWHVFMSAYQSLRTCTPIRVLAQRIETDGCTVALTVSLSERLN